jgi:hypothetical protein
VEKGEAPGKIIKKNKKGFLEFPTIINAEV